MSLKYRIMITTFLLEAVMVALVLWLTLSLTSAATQAQFRKVDESVFHLLSHLAEEALYTQEFSGLQAYLDDIEDDSHVLGISLLDREGRVVASSSLSLLGSQDLQLTGGDNVWQTYPVAGASGQLGKLLILHSTGKIDAAIAKIRNIGIGAALACMLAIALASITLGKLLTRRLDALTQAAQDIAEGGILDVEVSSTGRDEVANLANAFNAMVKKLRHSVAALRHGEQRFQDFAEAGSDWLWEMDENLRFSYFSDNFPMMTDVAQDELLGKTREETGIPGVDPAAWDAHLADLAAHRPFRDFQHARRLADGREIHVAVSGNPLFDDGGRFLGYRGTAQDITKRVKAEQALAQSQATLTEAQELAKVGSWRWRITPPAPYDCSDEFARIFGLDAAEVIPYAQNRMLDLIHPGDRGRVRDLHQSLKDNNRDYEVAYRVVRPDGETRHLLEIASVICDESGQPFEYLGIVQDVTELKLTQEELARTSSLFRAIVENAPMSIAVRDLEGCFVLANPHYEQAYGLSTTPDRGRSMREIFPDEKASISLETDKRVAASGAPESYDQKSLNTDGGERSYIGTKFPVRDVTDKVTHVGLIEVDITERKRAEEALLENRAALAEAQRIAHIGNWRWSISHNRLISCSDELLRIYGVSQDELYKETNGRGWAWVHPEDQERVAKCYANADLYGQGYEIEYRIVRGDGEVRHLRETAEVVFDDNGKAIENFGTTQDTSDRRKTEAAKRLSDERFQSAFRTAPHGMALVGLGRQWIAVNPALCELCGYSERELLRLNYRSVMHPSDVATSEPSVRQLLSGRIDSYQAESRIIHKDGHEISVLLSASLVRDSDGQPANFVAQLFDLTDRKQTEAALRQAQKLEAVGQLTGGIAHDFNNLLSVILGNLQLLQRSVADDPRSQRRIGSALEATNRGAELTKRLLAFARQQALDPEVVDAGQLLLGMCDLLRRAVGEEIKMEVSASADIWLTKVDVSMLEAALLNLAINARDAMPEGGTLTIEAGNFHLENSLSLSNADVAPGDYVLLSVCDNGHGIAPELLDQVLEPFFTTKEVGQGSGLGLSMVFGFVKQSEGHMDVESALDRGTTVKIYLPRDFSTELLAPASISDETELASGTETILVVEDDPAVREIAVFMLEELGYSVIVAEDGQSALTALENGPNVDLLFTDIIMPGGMRGDELTRRARERIPGLKVLHCTGYADSQNGEDDLFDAEEVLAKPYRVEDLAAKVRQVLGHDIMNSA